MRSTLRPYHHGNLRAALLDAAERALERDGARELSLRELARELRVSHSAPRRHFADKQALLDALAEGGFAQLEAALAPAGEGDLVTRMRVLGRAYVRFAAEHAALLELMYARKHHPDAAPALREGAARAFAAPLALVVDAQAAGEIVAGETQEVGRLVWATLHGIAALSASGLLGGPDVDLDAVVDGAVQRLLLGLRPR